MEILILVIAILFFNCWLAGTKNRSKVNWFFISFFFGIFATIALALLPKLDEK